MRKLILSVLGIMFSFAMFSQGTSLTVAQDFTVTDTQGEVHNLFNYLDDGKIVILDFIFVT
jgi:cytochrome oxidase Cu insertion factor (SCO1/SenC/PrrC family)